MDKRYQLRGTSGPVANQVIELAELDMTLGRDLSNDIVVSDSEVSRNHARLTWQGDGYTIQDLRSTNGTWVNGNSAMRAARLTAGDMVAVGKVSVFVFELVPEPETDTTREQEVPEPPDLIESTMLMPAWQAEAMKAREVVRARPLSAPAQLSPGRSFHQKYAACLEAGDSEGLLSLYHPDATLLSIDANVTGIEAIARFFEQYFGGLGSFGAKPTGKYVEGRDSILCETTVETGDIVARVHDVFVFRDGKATHHFTYTIETTSKLAILLPTKAS
jgi:pSer/pThr/pTyr-binding forkhead associated (FHA) protein